jgi:hypothetical protein
MRSSYPAPECFIAVAWLYLLDFHKDLCIGIFSFRTHAEQPVKQDCDFFHVGTRITLQFGIPNPHRLPPSLQQTQRCPTDQRGHK